MKKHTKTATELSAKPAAATADTAPEPTDAELRAIEHENADENSPLVSLALASAKVDLARLGLDEMAYVRRAIVNDTPVWSIHSAMGDPLGAAPTLAQAWGAIVQNDLQPVFVH